MISKISACYLLRLKVRVYVILPLLFIRQKHKVVRKEGTMSHLGLVASVRSQADDSKIQLSFSYSDEVLKERMFNFNRSKDESLGTFIGRIQINIESVCNKKLKRGKKTAENGDNQSYQKNLTVILQDENKTPLPSDTLNMNAWKNGLTLIVGLKKYNVVVNAPTVKSLVLPKSIMAGLPVYPKVCLEFASKEESTYEWFRSLNREEVSQDACFMAVHWQKAGSGYSFMTKSGDINRTLKVVCEPRSGAKSGFAVETVSQKKVSAGPGPCPFEERHLYTQEPTTENSFRVVTYNILADLYADSDHTRTVLYPYCPPYALDADYRKQILIKEILGYSGDLLCLQEVDGKLFRHDLQPLLTSLEMEGHYFEKGGQVVEGLACFTRKSKFRVCENDGIILAEQFPNNPIFSDIFLKISENQKLIERVLARTTALQYLLLESVSQPNRQILVANTHLYYHPDADHIRLLQAAICIRFLENQLEEYNKKCPEKSISVVFCGDFNSCPEFGVYQLMTTGSVPHSSEDWKSAPEEYVQGVSVSQDIGFASACGTPEYTNYTPFFSGCLDYIYYQDALLELKSWVPLPSHEDVIRHTALPSVVFPSDHIPLIAVLAWKT